MAKKRNTGAVPEAEAAKRILAALLHEFRQRNLGAQELENKYEGMSLSQLKELCCTDTEISEVDFDLAMKDLEEGEFIGTVPMDLFVDGLGSPVTAIGFYSKREYAHLTETGYKAATRARLTQRAGSNPRVHISGGIFHNSPIGVGNEFSQAVTVSSGPPEMFERMRDEIQKHITDQAKQSEILARLDALEAAEDQPSRMQRYNQFVSVIGDHLTVLGFLLPPFFIGLWERAAIKSCIPLAQHQVGTG